MRKPAGLIATAAIFTSAACAGGVEVPTAVVTAHDAAVTTELIPQPWNSFKVCKVGSNATFEVVINGGAPTQVPLLDGECRFVATWNGAGFDYVTVREIVPDGFQLDSIVKDSIVDNVVTRIPTLTGTAEVSGILYHPKGVVARFYNSAVPPEPHGGSVGCTPGYWKQSQHFDSWPLALQPSTQFSTVFADAFPGMSLLQVLSRGGGGLNALGRHTVAALLNASSIDYGMDTADVVAAFNAAYARGTYETLKNELATLNERGCPLN